MSQDSNSEKAASPSVPVRIDELIALNSLSRTLSASLSYSGVVKAGLEGVRAILKADLVFMMECQGRKLVFKEISPESERPRLKGFDNHLLGECLCGLTAVCGKPIYSTDIFSDVRCTRDECKNAGFKSLATLPLFRGSILLGFMGIASCTQRCFEGHKDFIESISHQMSLNLTNALNFEASQSELEARKQATEALSLSEDRFKNIVNASPMGIHMYQLKADNRLVFTGANPAAGKILGVDHSQFMGKTIEEAFAPLAQTEVPQRYRAAAGQGELWRTEQIDYDDAGIRGAFDVVAFQTSPGRMAALFFDITERKRAEEALLTERERLAVTLKSIGDGVITTDTRGNVVLMNKVAEALCGWVQDKACGKPLTEVFKIINEITRQPCENPAEKVLAFGKIIELANHTVLISRDGVERIIADSGAPITSSQGEVIGVVLVFRDMTEKTRLVEAAQNNQKLESLGVLAGGIAHDFNNLLGGIFGAIDLSLEHVKGTPAQHYLEEAMNVMERAKALTQQLLTFSKGGSPVKKNAPLFPFVEEAAKFALSGSNVSCSFQVPNNVHYCSYDKNQMGQVIDNIILNAQQAMPKGGNILITAANEELQGHGILPNGSYVRLSIKDQGIGIPQNILPNIFDPFFTTKTKGHGLGLATCHSIVSRHGGDLRAESEPCNGSVFTILLPAVDHADTKEPVSQTSAPSGQGRVLIMDDVPVLRNVIKKMLEGAGYTVDCVDDGAQAISAFQEARKAGAPFKAAIFDLTIPGGMGGKETISEIRKMDKSVPVIVSSGYARDPIMANPENFGFTASLSKPFTKKIMLELLSRLMGKG